MTTTMNTATMYDEAQELARLREANARLTAEAVGKCLTKAEVSVTVGDDGKGYLDVVLPTKGSKRTVSLTRVQWLALMSLVGNGTIQDALDQARSVVKL